MAKLTPQELADFAVSQIPTTGEISYRELHQKIRQSDNPEAVEILPELKRRGLVEAKISFGPDGIKHTYSRKAVTP